MRWIFGAMLLAVAAWPGGATATGRHAHHARHAHHNPVVLHLQDIWETTHEKTAGKAQATHVQFVIGNNVWRPGEHYQSGKDWLALTCRAESCVLRPASLTVRSKSRQGAEGEQPEAGQQLSFRGVGKSTSGKAVAWLHLENAPAWLKPGPVPAYGTQVPAGKEDTREVEVKLPGNAHATLVPMLLTADLSRKLTHRYLPRHPHDTGSLHLQLRAGKKRQLLPGELATCGHRVKPGYLLWAGDMDGDGSPDYLVSYVDMAGPVHLYLSSAANAGQLVGLVGTFKVAANREACDGELPSYLLH